MINNNEEKGFCSTEGTRYSSLCSVGGRVAAITISGIVNWEVPKRVSTGPAVDVSCGLEAADRVFTTLR